jgi:hypothetical protein
VAAERQPIIGDTGDFPGLLPADIVRYMQTLGGLSLMAALVLCYVLYFRSQASTAENGSDESRPIAVAPAHAGPSDLRKTAAPPGVYKADLDRAHDAARQMQVSHDEANSF